MAPFAICLNKLCRNVLDADDFGREDWTDPIFCKKCGADMLVLCYVCRSCIPAVPTLNKPYCIYCGFNLYIVEINLILRRNTIVCRGDGIPAPDWCARCRRDEERSRERLRKLHQRRI